MSKTKITLNIKSIEAAIERVNKYKNIESKLDELCEKIAILGVDTANYSYGQGIVRHEKTPTGYMIIAQDQQICFLEFGTGTLTDIDKFSQEVSIEVYPGSWSKDHAKTYERWLSTGEPSSPFGGYLYDSPPKRGMWNASLEMKKEIKRLVEETFR